MEPTKPIAYAGLAAAALLSLFCACGARPQPPAPAPAPTTASPPSAKIEQERAFDRRVAELVAQGHVVGLAYGFVEDGHVHRTKSLGLADAEANAPLQPGSILYAASLTKAAFAYLVMALVDEGVLTLDATLPDLLKKPLPEYADYTDLATDPRWRKLTPRMLLAHTSGLLNWRWINDDKKLDFKFDPGSRYVYSGEGIQILQLVVEERTGQSVSALMKSRVFDRFGMKNTSMTWREDFAARAASEHDAGGKALGHAKRSRPRAAGSMDTTIYDYAAFVAGALRGEGLREASRSALFSPQIAIVSPQEFPSHWPGETDVWRPIGLSYALGWGTYTTRGGAGRPPPMHVVFKEGHDDGTNNLVLAFPDTHSALVILSNSGNAEAIFPAIVEAAFGDVCLPWFWMGYIPEDRPDLRSPEARKHPSPACR